MLSRIRAFSRGRFRRNISLIWGGVVVCVAGVFLWRIAHFVATPPSRGSLPVIPAFRGMLRIPAQEEEQEPSLRVYENVSGKKTHFRDTLKAPEPSPVIARVNTDQSPTQRFKPDRSAPRSSQRKAMAYGRKRPLTPSTKKPSPRVSSQTIESFLSRLSETRKRREADTSFSDARP